jgi:hypothetical protein
MIKGSPYFERRKKLREVARELEQQKKFKELEETVKGTKHEN